MPRKTKSVGEESSSEKVAEQVISVSHESDIPEFVSIDKCDNDSSDISQFEHLQDEVRMLEIQSRRLEIEERLQRAKERLRLMKSRLPEQSLTSLDKVGSESDEIEKHSLKHEFGPYESYYLPKTELACFDGNPAQYWSFMCDFENSIAKRVSDDGLRLTYLKYYCRGPAREAIEGCSMFPPREGYHLALQNLKELFGDEHQVSRSLLDSLKNDIKRIRDKPTSWQLLVIKMKDCKLAFNQMGKSSHLDTYETLESLLRCFPSDIRDKWIKLCGKLKSKNAAPDFSHLIELVVEKANCSSNVYSHLSSILDRPTNIKRNESTNPNSRVFLTSVSNDSSKIICPKCLKAHQLHDCPEFRDMPPKQRLEYVKLKGRCFSCLKGNHTLRECRIRRNCSDHCRKLHHPLLHDGLISDNSEVVKPTCSSFYDM